MVNKDLKFSHIPKTAGTSIEHIGLKHGIKWGKFDRKHLEQHYGKPCLGIHHIPLWKFKSNPYKNADTFAVIRHPLTRIISLYIYSYEMFPQFRFLIGNKATAKNLNKFISMLINTKFLVVIPALYGLFQPQYDFIYDRNGEKVVTHVLRFEKLDQEFPELMKKYNLPLTLDEHRYRTNSTKKLSPDDITLRNRRILYRFYKKDFDVFGYDRNKW